MELKIKYDMHEIEESMTLLVDSMDDLTPILQRFSAYKRGNVKGIFKAEGAGKWKPLAKSTVERLEHTGTSKVTAQGKLRASYLKVRSSQLKSIKRKGAKAARRASGISSIKTFFDSGAALKKQKLLAKATKGESAYKENKELEALYLDGQASVSPEHKSLGASKKKIAKVEAGKNVSIGKRAIEKHKLLGKLGNSIEAKITKGQLVIQSKVPWSEAQNDGDIVGNNATLPARVFLELTEEDMEMFVEIAQDYMLEKSGLKPKKSKGSK